MIKKNKFSNIAIMLFLAIIVLCSCSPIKRHQRLVAKFPHVHTQDTIILRDTIRINVPKIEVDSIFLTKNLIDTVTIIKDRLKIKMYTVHDSIYVTGSCDTVTIEKIIERKIPVVYYEKSPDWFEKEKNWFWLFLAIVVGSILIIKITRK